MKNQIVLSGSKTVCSNLSINWRKGCSFMADTLCTINFWLRQTILCKRMPLFNGSVVSSILFSKGKNVPSSNSFEVICTHTISPDALIELRETMRLGRSLACDKSVNGNGINTMSRWLNNIVYFFRWAKASSHRASSGLSQASAREASDRIKDRSSVFSRSTLSPISSATRMSNSILSEVSVTMLKTVFMETNIHFYLSAKKSLTVKCLGILLLFFASFPAKAQNITAFEYFFDTDPGIGLGTAVTPAPSPIITDFNLPISTAALPSGFHTLYIRGRNTGGEWTHTHFRNFYVVPPPPTVDITQLEYFVDTDPGFGAATQVTGITPSPVLTNIPIDITAAAFTPGFHTLYVRGKNGAGEWTHTHFRNFYVVSILPSADISQIEYFVDTDPGVGAATQVTGLTPSATITNLAIDITASAYSVGFHTLYVRSKNSLDEWTHTHFRNFYIANTPTADNLVKFEYFFDTDPGFDNGTATPVAPPVPSVTNQDIFAIPSSLSVGSHTIYVRAKDSSGDWTQVVTGTFSVTASLPPSITSFTPTSGPIGTTVTITGTNFDATPANNIVYFGATRATVTSATATQLTVTVPVGATYQPITVQVAGLTGFSSKPFVVTFAGGGSIDACSFAPRIDYATIGITPGLEATGAVADIDGDGKTDVLVSNRENKFFSVYRNCNHR